MLKTLLISDLHLDPERPDIQDCFDQFIHSCLEDASNIDAVYILGDLFEVWIGDDASIPLYQHSISRLKNLSKQNIKLYVMHGNRDFLLGSAFELAAGCTLIPDLYHLKTKQETILLSHGDIFCTDDIEYMQFRKMVRNAHWKTEFLAKPIPERIEIALSMRNKSKQKAQQQQSEIMDVNQTSIEKIMLEQGVNTLIHGHTHRPAMHEFILNNKAARRIVLPDWKPGAEVLIL
jgi:UDP-2,3-diacylglucosamine hydrolase